METNENLIPSLKHLLSICNDGKEGYRNAAENVDAPELKVLLTTYSLQRAEYADALKTSIRQAGGDPDNSDGGPLGALHRAWIDIKTAFTINDNKAVLDACVTGEKAAIEAYDKALDNDQLSSVQRQLLVSQRSGITQSLQNVENLEHQYA
ncbi:ferritin-like domain-containing protein [Hufsiella ginkgonis]|uniref:PA2169 family four-helix-bundle protein n=1 Tax=Hufsiella ginkgonis TaxID=2695274 RepID=A0A7K1XVS4_9SPHI|nr:PA2169 family four-helix-bundle protein [Hufsiella ginkgonis]MXV15093.1 PA2169 family four-helix-bundle protein [Hufsiella ginkgonis]